MGIISTITDYSGTGCYYEDGMGYGSNVLLFFIGFFSLRPR